MTRARRVVVVGAGDVGARVTRELVATGWTGVDLVTSRSDRVGVLVDAFGDEARVVLSGDPTSELPDRSLVVVAGAARHDAELAARAVARGNDLIVVTDDRDVVESLLALDGAALEQGVRVVAGAAVSPGLSCLMASFGSEQLDVVEEVHVARVGAGGPTCRAARRRALRAGGYEWRDGEWRRTPVGAGRELVWFPDPLGARDCYAVGTAEPLLLRRRFPGVRRAVVRMAMSRVERMWSSLPAPMPEAVLELSEDRPGSRRDPLGAVRVELRGARGGTRTTLVLGAIDLPSMACGAIVAHVAEELLGSHVPPGVRGLGEWPAPGRLLAGLRGRGVRIAVAEDLS
jgi:hypothetical protein